MIPSVKIAEDRHWKVGDGLDVNGGEIIGQIALVFLDKTHFQVRLYNEIGKLIMVTPGVLDSQCIKDHHGTIPEPDEFRVHSTPTSKRKVIA